MALNVEVFTKTEHGALFIGKTAGFFAKQDGTQWTVCETERGEIFFAETQKLRPVRELYGVK